MNRRKFIQLSATATATAIINPAISKAINLNKLADCDHQDRVLVLIQLSGGNDGLNTLIPINQYDVYANLRPDIKIADSGANTYMPLDNSLSNEDAVGLHPVLTGFKSLYENDQLNIIQGVSYPDHNRSHFRSTDIWLTGADGTQENATINDGWMARYLHYEYTEPLDYPLGVQIGNKKNSRGFSAEHTHDISLNITGQNPSGFYNIVSGLGGEFVSNIPDSDYGDNIAHIQAIDEFSNTYGGKISTAFDAGSNSVAYPDTDIANQLKSVARLIDGGLQTKIYIVNISGFDTHDNQVVADEAHLGAHAQLLQNLSDAALAFFNDLEVLGHADRVIASTFSEFGRKVRQNGNLGTDHGQVAPLFLFGKAVQTGLMGTNVDLAEATEQNNYQLTSIQHDYRQIFSSIVQDWFGISDDGINTIFPDYYNNTPMADRYINLLKSNYMVDPSCYENSTSIHSIWDKKGDHVLLYPNPAPHYINLEFPQFWSGMLTITNLKGQIVKQQIFDQQVNILQINVNNLPTGKYICTLTNKADIIVKKLVKL